MSHLCDSLPSIQPEGTLTTVAGDPTMGWRWPETQPLLLFPLFTEGVARLDTVRRVPHPLTQQGSANIKGNMVVGSPTGLMPGGSLTQGDGRCRHWTLAAQRRDIIHQHDTHRYFRLEMQGAGRRVFAKS